MFLPLITLIIILLLQTFTTPFINTIPILIPLLLPTIAPPLLPILHINQLNHPPSLPIPLPFTFSPFTFHLTSTLLFFILPILTLIHSTPLYHPLTQITPNNLQTKHFPKPYTAQPLPILLRSI
ncbi:solute carrier family 23 protein, partial [Staphylococcus aureus]|uniref:solute carrier family 23 protein n=1 Tax=Staphylococcus aureus TaxID=1280 RepID=UPI0037DA753D